MFRIIIIQILILSACASNQQLENNQKSNVSRITKDTTTNSNLQIKKIFKMTTDSMSHYLISLQESELREVFEIALKHFNDKNTYQTLENSYHKKLIYFASLMGLYCKDQISQEMLNEGFKGYFFSGELSAMILQSFEKCDENEKCLELCYQLDKNRFRKFEFDD